jgi:hypothetical protein
MAKPIDIPDASAMLAVEPHRRFVCFVALAAAWRGADVVRFEPVPGGWAILSPQGGAWEEFLAPVDAAAAVPRTLRAMARRSGLLGLLVVGGASAEFSLRLGEGETIDCWAARDGAAHQLRVEARGLAPARAGDLLRSYLRLAGHCPSAV